MAHKQYHLAIWGFKNGNFKIQQQVLFCFAGAYYMTSLNMVTTILTVSAPRPLMYCCQKIVENKFKFVSNKHIWINVINVIHRPIKGPQTSLQETLPWKRLFFWLSKIYAFSVFFLW